MTTFRFDLPIPPSTNGAYYNVPGRGRVATKANKEWKAEAGWMIKLAHPGRIEGKFRFTILLPENMRGDVDNRVKLALDVLGPKGCGVTPDDRHAVSAKPERSAEVPSGRCIVIVESVA